MFDYDVDSVFVLWLLLFYDMGLIGNVLYMFYFGVCCYLMMLVVFL